MLPIYEGSQQSTQTSIRHHQHQLPPGSSQRSQPTNAHHMSLPHVPQTSIGYHNVDAAPQVPWSYEYMHMYQTLPANGGYTPLYYQAPFWPYDYISAYNAHYYHQM